MRLGDIPSCRSLGDPGSTLLTDQPLVSVARDGDQASGMFFGILLVKVAGPYGSEFLWSVDYALSVSWTNNMCYGTPSPLHAFGTEDQSRPHNNDQDLLA